MADEHLLVVEDEDNLRTMLVAALRHSGFRVTAADSGRQALELVADVRPELIVLDVMMSDTDGFEVCRRLRAANDLTPVLFLTARDAPDDKLLGFRLGADDYLVKPFSIEELVARISAVLRRVNAPTREPDVLGLHDLELDEAAHLVRRAGRTIHLSPTEFKLLRYLLVNQGRVVSKVQILDSVWDYDFEGDSRVVETYIGYLRRKVDSGEPKLIHTVRGVGYVARVEL